MGNELEWKVNTPGLLKEIGNTNPSMSILRSPLMILSNILYEVGERASELNDPILNGLMCRLAIYEISDPYSAGYDKNKMNKVMRAYKRAKKIK